MMNSAKKKISREAVAIYLSKISGFPVPEMVHFITGLKQRKDMISLEELNTTLNSERLLKVLFKAIEASEEIIIITNANDRIGDEEIIFVNKGFEKVTGYKKEEAIGRSPSFLQGPKTERDTINKLKEVLGKGERFEGEAFNYKKDGSSYRVRWSIDPIQNQEGEITHFISIQRDVTKEWEQHKKLKEMISERETLIKETHHRLKNNLATIAGLLELQVMESDSAKVQKVLSKSINRVRSIASIHEKLYESEGITSIAMDIYIRDLIKDLQNSMNYSRKDVRINTDIASLTLNASQAVSCGLILNELITNSYNHAFEDKEEGRITVNFQQKDGEIHAEVRDEGKGLPENLNLEELPSLGLKLIHTLCQQLNAEYTFKNDNGMAFHMHFKKEET